MSKRIIEKVIIENIILLAIIILVVGIVFVLFTTWQSVGEMLISSGFLSIIVYLVVGQHSEFVMREKHLGIEKGQTLLEALATREVSFRKYEYLERNYEWELFGGTDEKWASKVTETIHLRINENVDHITFSREADERMGDTIEAVQIKDKASGKMSDIFPSLIADLSIPYKKYFRLSYNFEKGRDYILRLTYTYPPCMRKDFDYIYMLNPVLTHKSKITIKLPEDFDLARYTVDCYVMDMRFERVKTIDKDCSQRNRKIVIKEVGPLFEGETILFKYKLKQHE
jgi:hypothetical protein